MKMICRLVDELVIGVCFSRYEHGLVERSVDGDLHVEIVDFCEVLADPQRVRELDQLWLQHFVAVSLFQYCR